MTATQRMNGDRALPSDAVQKTVKPRLEGIQICRGIAALLVLLFHATQLSQEKLGQPFLGNLFAFGGAGVDFFFVLSGFIIFFVHQADVGKRDRLKPFILKRLIRIYPLYWLITLAILPIYFLEPQLGYGYERDLAVIIKSLLLVPQQHFPILIVGWSLSHEMLFYGLFALAIVLPLRRFSYLLLGWFIGTIAVLLSSLSDSFNLDNYFLFKFVFSAHNFEFLFGCLAADLIRKNRFNTQKTGFLFLGTSLFLLFGIAQAQRSLILNPVFAYGLPSMLIVLGSASFDVQRSCHQTRSSLARLFTSLGDASYSIYLTHYLCLSVFLKLIVATNLISSIGYTATISLLLATTLGVGYLTYAWIEVPMANGLRRTVVNPQAIATKPLNSTSATRAMKILFLDQSGELAGAELCLLDIVQPYRDRCLVCLFTDGPFQATLKKRGVPVQVLATKPMRVRKESGLVQGLQSLGQLLPLALQVARLSRNYDLIYANTQKALVVGALASVLSRRPLVYHLHDILSIDHFSPTNRRLAVTLANRCASQVIATSKASLDAFISAGGQADLAAVVYNGFEPNLYKVNTNATQLRQQMGLVDRFVVGHFSRLSPWKGQHILLEALVHCPEDVAVLFVGDALFGEQDYVQTLKAQVEKLGLRDRVHFLGFRSDVVPLMQACNLVAHTSTAPEPFGRVIAEAMLCGRPVIASASGGAVELIESSVTGWLVPPGDVKALAAAIAHCQANPAATQAIAKAAQVEAIDRFDLKQIRQQIDQLLQVVVSC
ncbi:MAG: glycosyltransferase [Tildeniella nuda ZEHNDER 1965/U140]|nr:glycosyltransferase [Tildeniella nuda ZEHNDER 1965/U140]